VARPSRRYRERTIGVAVTTKVPDRAATEHHPDLRGGLGQVILATLASTAGFWAWMAIAPLQNIYAEKMGLDQGQISLMLATPVLVGSLGRIVVGALTDRFGGRRCSRGPARRRSPPCCSWRWPDRSAASGCSWSRVSARRRRHDLRRRHAFSSAWFPPARRGFANGIFGMGMIGTAVSAFATPRLAQSIGYLPTHLLIAGVLVVMAALVWFFLRESPAWQSSRQPLVPKVKGALKLAVTWQMSFLYAIVFGGFVAFSTYLPKYLVTIYPDDVDAVGAGTRTALFAAAAVIARPIGGVLADKFGPKIISLVSLAGSSRRRTSSGSSRPRGAHRVRVPLDGIRHGPRHGRRVRVGRPVHPARQGRRRHGVVAAAGGLGGYFPPLVMGATYHAETNSYALGLWLLVLVGAAALVVAGMLRDARPAK
jgi:NNP family nitrate/nitrite transporter-like MFS transporter